MKTRKIYSDPNQASPKPWFKFTVQDGSLDVSIEEENGLLPFREERARSEGKRLTAAERSTIARANPRTHTFALSTERRPPTPNQPESLAEEPHVLLVTLDGDWELVPFSKQPFECYAHLAIYDPATGEWEVLVFEPEHN